MMSNMAKASGVKPENAITIPKRCNFEDRPIGYKCRGDDTYSKQLVFNAFIYIAHLILTNNFYKYEVLVKHDNNRFILLICKHKMILEVIYIILLTYEI